LGTLSVNQFDAHFARVYVAAPKGWTLLSAEFYGQPTTRLLLHPLGPLQNRSD